VSCDIFHALTYEGMPPLLGPSSTQRAIFFWLMGRTFEVTCMALLAFGKAPALFRRFPLVAGGLISAVLIWFGSYQIDNFPVTFVKGQGVTAFKANYEYLLCLFNLLVAGIFWRRAQASGESRDYLLSLSVFVMGVGELMFTAYVRPSDFQNIYGHGFKVAAYVLLFRATFVTSMRAPFEVIRESENRLYESEERWKFALEGSGDGVWDVNLVTEEAYHSRRYQEMLGYAQGEFAENYHEWFDHIHPHDRPGVIAALEAYTHQVSPHYATEYRMRCKDKRYIWIAAQGMVVSLTAEGKPLRMIGTHKDITERKRAEAELQEHRIHLERLVEERTAELSVAMAQAESANNAKSRFLAAASHDLRQPLSALGVYTSLLKNTPAAADRKVVANMQVCINGLNELLNDLLDLSKLNAGVVTPAIHDFSVAELFDSLASVYAPEAALKGLKLRFLPGSWTGRTDAVLLRRSLSNLIENALRYTQRGGVLVACRRRMGKTWIEVWDSGIGIPEDKMADIFEEFRQLGDSARNNGSGLGLAIVTKMAALLGLEIKVRSRLGRGSVFAIELPLGESARIIAAPTPQATTPRTLRIALVDDHAIVRESLCALLEYAGHAVLAAATQAELLAGLAQFAPDILLSDYRLAGGETGFDVITAVRSRLGAEFPAILITGDTDPALLRSMNGRSVIVMHKPLNLEILEATLESLASQMTLA
ncbi:MAG: PAS domain-containing protein, partial [Polaromonas sp.]|nr:PAS domain-containing protein [Polaromonas sp.]